MNPFYKNEIVLTEAEFGLFFEGAHLEKRFVESPSMAWSGRRSADLHP
jgi:hypothetical protein